MALIRCDDCGREFSSAAKACPQCGRPRSSISWTTITVLVVVVVLGWSATQMASTPGGAAQSERYDAVADVRPVAPSSPCTATAFEVREVNIPKRRNGYIWFVGVVHNGNSVPCAVELQASGYSTKGAMLNTTNFWPASTKNIAPGAQYNFDMMMDDVAAIDRIEVTPIGARQW